MLDLDKEFKATCEGCGECKMVRRKSIILCDKCKDIIIQVFNNDL